MPLGSLCSSPAARKTLDEVNWQVVMRRRREQSHRVGRLTRNSLQTRDEAWFLLWPPDGEKLKYCTATLMTSLGATYGYKHSAGVVNSLNDMCSKHRKDMCIMNASMAPSRVAHPNGYSNKVDLTFMDAGSHPCVTFTRIHIRMLFPLRPS